MLQTHVVINRGSLERFTITGEGGTPQHGGQYQLAHGLMCPETCEAAFVWISAHELAYLVCNGWLR